MYIEYKPENVLVLTFAHCEIWKVRTTKMGDLVLPQTKLPNLFYAMSMYSDSNPNIK